MKQVIALCLGSYGVLFMLSMMFGLIHGFKIPSNGLCKTNMSRIEYIAPAYRLGCWLGERPGDK